MEIPRHWRLRGPRLRLEGLRDKITGVVEFPSKANPKVLYNSSLLLPNDQVVHSEVVRKNQEQDDKAQN